MTPIDFTGPYLKTERAKHHIDKLKEVFRRHITANQKTLRREGKGQHREGVGRPLPEHTPTILGDALHNLRASLDHAYCILVEANRGTVNKHVKFPIVDHTDWKSLKGSVDGHAKSGFAPSREVIDHIFNVIQPYEGGNGQNLVNLHVLDIADKHMILLPTRQNMRITNVEFENGISISGITISTPSGAGAIGPGLVPVKGVNQQASFEICFGEGQPYQGQPVLGILDSLHAHVVSTLGGLEDCAKKG